MNSSPNSERTRLARELHDGLAQELAAFGYQLDQVIGDENLGNSNRSTLRELRLSLSSVINQVRDEIYELRSNKSKAFHQQLSEQIEVLLSGSEIKVVLSMAQVKANTPTSASACPATEKRLQHPSLLMAKKHSPCAATISPKNSTTLSRTTYKKNLRSAPKAHHLQTPWLTN